MKLNLNFTRQDVFNFFPDVQPGTLAWDVLVSLIETKEDSERKDLSIKAKLPIGELVAEVKKMDYRFSQKIAAIKFVRQFCFDRNIEVGLAEAKHFVEAL